MGNCCKVNKKIKSPPPPEPGTMTTEDRSQITKLQIVCESPEINLSILYRSAIPIQDIKEQILADYPELNMKLYSLYRSDLEILDATATLKQLGILPGDTLFLKINQVYDESDDIIASENNSIPELDDSRNEITGLTFKKNLVARTEVENVLTSPKRHAQELWRTSLPSPPSRPLIKCDPLDVSSFTNNTNDHSLKPPQATFQVPPIIDSDDSNIEDNKREKDNQVNFKDLQGPFFMFQRSK
jgi:hypothetical protein